MNSTQTTEPSCKIHCSIVEVTSYLCGDITAGTFVFQKVSKWPHFYA